MVSKEWTNNHHKCTTVKNEGQLYSQKIAGEVGGAMTRTPSELYSGRLTSCTRSAQRAQKTEIGYANDSVSSIK